MKSANFSVRLKVMQRLTTRFAGQANVALALAAFSAMSAGPCESAALRFAYVANAGDGSISGFTVTATGGLKPVAGSPFPAGNLSFSITATPDGVFAYAPSASAGTVSAYRIDSETGALTQIVGSPFSITGLSAYSSAITPNGSFLYVPNSSGIAGYGRNGIIRRRRKTRSPRRSNQRRSSRPSRFGQW